ncbi:MAG: glycosyltransferase family 2 protein [Solirubrobacterales bacterium]
MIKLSVVIPSRERERVLSETLRRLLEQANWLPVEVIVVYDGPSAERRIATEMAGTPAIPLTVTEQPALGPAAARNRGIELARGDACLFLGDDAWPRDGLLEHHLGFHRSRPGEREAMLGRADPAPPLDRSPFIRWLHSDGVQFGYGGLKPGPVGPECFWTANVSAKTSLLREAGGFDEAFTDAACEDAELGLRLARAGMRLTYDPEAITDHYHPTDLERTIGRMRRVGRAYRVLEPRAPELPMPTPPSAKHRLKAAALAPLALVGADQRRTWRFLCDEAQREAYWRVEPPAGRRLAIGDRLARVAIRGKDARGVEGEGLG